MSFYDRQLAVSGGVLHHIGLLLAAEEARCEAARAIVPEVRCAWCDRERGVTVTPGQPLVSHTICARHLAAMKAELVRRADGQLLAA